MPVAFHRRAVQHSFRYMDAYRKGLTGPLLEYAVRKYRSHRTIPGVNPLPELGNEYKEHRQCKLEGFPLLIKSIFPFCSYFPSSVATLSPFFLV